MVVYAYIGVAAVVGLLIGLVTLSVIWTVKTVGRSIRDRSMTLMTTYDKLLEERSRDLKAMDEALREKQELLKEKEEEEEEEIPYSTVAAPAFLQTVERYSNTPYRDDGTADAYRKIRSSFCFAPDDVLSRLPISMEGRNEGHAGHLLKEMSFDTIYQMSTLSPEKQYSVLSETIPEEEQYLLKEFSEMNRDFDCIAFYDFIQAKAAMEPGPVYLRVSPDTAKTHKEKNMTVVPDENICEGFQIEADNVLYDYCIRMEEIG